MERRDQVKLILPGREKRIYDLHGDLDLDLRLSGPAFVQNVDEQVPSLFGDTDVIVIALHGDVFAVLGGAHGIRQRAQVNVVRMDAVNLDLPGVEPVLVDGGEDFFGQLAAVAESPCSPAFPMKS